MVSIAFNVDAEHNIAANSKICMLPKWAGTGYGFAVGGNHMFNAYSQGGKLITSANIPGGTSIVSFIVVNYKG